MRRRLAKIAFRASGWLSRIKTWQRTYEIVNDEFPFEFRALPRRWLPCGTANRLLKLSMTLDMKHWDHWALVHDRCGGIPCSECGGTICEQVA